MNKRFRIVWTLSAGWLLAVAADAAQIHFDFTKTPPGQTPAGFFSLATGHAAASIWRVREDAVPPTIAPLTEKAREETATQSVLAPAAGSSGPGDFSVLLYTNEVFSEFVLTARMKISSGEAGVVLRAQDANNYYVVRASTEGNLLWYRVVGGKAYDMLGVGVRLPFPPDVWQELKVECAGNQTRCYLNGKLVIPPAKAGAPTNDLAVNDTTFARGKIGFWRRGDAKCAFAGARVQYMPKVPFAETVVADIREKYPRLLGLKIYANKESNAPVIIADLHGEGVGSAGAKYEEDVIQKGVMYYLPDGKAVEVTMPLRDRNGEVAAALKTRMTTFPGESRDNAIARATVIRKAIEQRMKTLQDSLMEQ